jgi:hypothetical protein
MRHVVRPAKNDPTFTVIIGCGSHDGILLENARKIVRIGGDSYDLYYHSWENGERKGEGNKSDKKYFVYS